ncbi:MAG: hypothetical protein BWY21_00336 [Parcubacteria group bacterium ADurb.Bin216]|nr:MAG: hypothetical protein BWY21_00336 [Parcubacteria group bacterium ADurb.Bin216]
MTNKPAEDEDEAEWCRVCEYHKSYICPHCTKHELKNDDEQRGYQRALEEVEKELNLTIDEAPIFLGEEDRGYTIKVCEWLKKNINNLKAKGGV